MIDGQTYYVLEDEGGTVHAITGGWEAPTFPDGVGAWALRQCSERNESREGDSRGGIVFRFTPEELRVWLQGAGPSLSQAFPGETWATFGNSRTCGEILYQYPGEWVWKPREADPFDGPDESFGVDPDLARDLERGK